MAAKTGKAENAYVKEGANGFRLPTQAEWEYAARGAVPSVASTSVWSYPWPGVFMDQSVPGIAWGSGNAGGKTQPVAELLPNSLGFYDLGGNVWEWNWPADISGTTGTAYRSCGNYEGSASSTTNASKVDEHRTVTNFHSTTGSGNGFRVVCAPEY